MTYNKKIKGKLFKYFEGRLKMKSSTKGYYRSDCPYCGGNYCFAVHIDKGYASCFKCEHRSKLLEVLMMMENFDTLNQAKQFINLQQDYDQWDGEGKVTKFERKPVELPDSFRLIIIREGLLGKNAQNYLKGRGFNLDKLAQAGVGYCLEGDYSGYIIFPFYQRTKLVFFQGRKFIGFGPKMQNPTNEDFGVGKTQIIYNHDALFLYTHINVVESITNALTLGDNTIALLGKSISEYQLKWLIRSPATHMTIILDDDALDKAAELAMILCPYKRIRLVRMPKEKDVNDLGKKKTKTLMKNTPFYGYEGYNRFRKIRQNFKGAVNTSERIRLGYSVKRGF